MRKHFLTFSSMMMAVALIIGVVGCKDDEEEPTAFTLTSLKSGTIDMNGATPPNNIPVEPTIIATFSKDVKASTANTTNIKLVRDYDDAALDLTITVSGATVTIVPTESIGNGAAFVLTMMGLQSTDDQALANITRSFTTEGTFVPAGQIAYWNFDDSADDQVGNFNPAAGGVIDIVYADSYNSEMGKAAMFNGSTSLIRIPNGDQLINTNDLTIAFWVKANSEQVGHFVMGLAGWNGFQFEIADDFGSCKLAAQYEFENGTSNSEDLWFAGDGNTSWQGWTFCKDLTTSGGVQFLLADKWAHIVLRYNSSTKVGTMYINGEKMKEQDFNLWPDIKATTVGFKYVGNAGNNTFVFGFIQDFEDPTIGDDWADYTNPDNKHFMGLIDNVRFYHKALTEQEIDLMYNSEKP